MKIIKYIFILAVFINMSFSIENYASFAEWNVGAKSLGMGRAYVGLADDASALYWNPAGIMKLKSMQTMFQMTMLYGDYGLMYGSFAMPGPETSLGFEFLMLNGSGIEGRDKFNQLTAGVSDSKMLVGLTFSKRLMQNLFMGIKGKYIMRSLGEASDMAIAGDLSMMYQVTEQFSVGWSLNNVMGMVIGKTNDKLLSSSTIGIAHKEKDLTFTLDSKDNFNEWHVGIESSFIKILPLRFGVNNNELCFGGGLNLGMIQFDFAYVMKELGSNIGFSSNICFGENMNVAQQNKIENYIKEAKELLSYDYFYMAKRKFENILILDPSREEVTAIINRLNIALPRVDSSLEKELSTWDKLKQALDLYENNKNKEALTILEEIQKTNSGNRFIINIIDEIRKKIK